MMPNRSVTTMLVERVILMAIAAELILVLLPAIISAVAPAT